MQPATNFAIRGLSQPAYLNHQEQICAIWQWDFRVKVLIHWHWNNSFFSFRLWCNKVCVCLVVGVLETHQWFIPPWWPSMFHQTHTETHIHKLFRGFPLIQWWHHGQAPLRLWESDSPSVQQRWTLLYLSMLAWYHVFLEAGSRI